MSGVPRLPDRIESGVPYPLGSQCDGSGTNFAVFSAHATRVDLCLFDAKGRRQIACYPLPECTDEIWHGYLPQVRGGQLYGYRAHGPYEPENGHRFNPHKLLLDPYARMLHGQLRWTDAVHGYRLRSSRADLSFDRRDSAAAVPKSIVVDDHFNWRGAGRPRVPWEDTVIYEAHLRGLSQQNERVRPDQRGSFAALADPRMIDHLLRLGITAIELLPIHAFLQDRRLVELKLRNYWGYNTLAYFAPEPGYLQEGNLHEIRRAVRALHEAGIEVILDVVYNHTAEGNELGPTLCFRGLDNASYYRLLPDNPRHCINDTGCGNTVNTAHPRVVQLVMDSLRYWVEEFHIDGFRFDLGAALGREAHGFDPDGRLFTAMRQDPILAGVKLISEPWDLGPGGYQLGNHPPGFAEWNDRFRDEVRGFWKGTDGLRGALADRLQGSADLFNARGRRPWASLNFITAHDGFTLQDVVSYSEKHNEANQEDNRDGHDDNASWNWGEEGPSEDPGILAQRGKVRRALLATLLLSQGTPMLLAGDEFGQTQHGNNNTYCQDNPLAWLDWSLLETPEGRALCRYVAELIRLRREHPTMGATRFVHGRDHLLPGVPDLSWFDERGESMADAAWEDPQGRLLAVRRSAVGPNGHETSLMLINGSHEDRDFGLPPPSMDWRLALDTATPEAVDDGGASPRIDAGPVRVASHSIRLLLADGNGSR